MPVTPSWLTFDDRLAKAKFLLNYFHGQGKSRETIGIFTEQNKLPSGSIVNNKVASAFSLQEKSIQLGVGEVK